MAVTVTRTSTLFTDTDGDNVVDPGEVVLVHILIQNTNATDILNLKVYDTQSGLTITDLSTVKITPIAFDDFTPAAPLTIVGNTPYIISASALLGNDIDPDGPEASLVISSFANQSHVTVTDVGGGNLQIVPETGYQGVASFDYFITDAQGLASVSSGHVNISISGMIWYVDSTANAVGADGSYLHRFQSLANLNDDGTTAAGTTGPNDGIKGDDDVDGANDTIFVFNNNAPYTGGITLEAGQKLYGDGHEMTVNGNAIGVAGQTNNTTINYSGYGVTLSTDNTIAGLNLNGTANGAVGIQDGGGSVTTAAGTLNIDTVSIGGAGQAVDIDQGGNLNVALTSLSTTGTAAGLQGVQLAGIASSGTALLSGTFTAAAGSIAGESSHGFLIGGQGPTSGGTIAVNYAGTIGSSTTGSAVNIQDRLGGAGNVTFSGNITQTSTASNTTAGIALSNIAGGTIDLTGTKTIAVNAGAQNAIEISGQSGGTINFSGGAIDIDLATTTTGHGFSVASQSGGAVNVSTAADIDLAGTASGRGVSISSSTAGSVNFTGGGLTIDSRVGAALFDSNAAGSTNALNISGAGNTLATTNGGQLVEIANAATTGITLNTLTTGAAVSTGAAVHVNNLDGGTFTTSTITVTGATGAGGDGVRIEGGSTTNFSLGNVSVVNTSEDGIELNGANGTVSMSSLNIQNTTAQGVEIVNATNAVTITTGTIGNLNDPTAEAVLITGGTGAVTVGATITKISAGNVVEITGHNTGAISFSNTISATGGLDNGILLTQNTGGTISFGGNVTLTTSTSDALTFTNNLSTGAAVSFTGGNLAVSTTTAKGINVSSAVVGAGSFTVTGANNTISQTVASATAVGLSVVGASIASTGLTFKSIGTNGAQNGIVLTNTGTVAGTHGGLTVTGDATASKTAGGSITNSVGVGINISGARDISLDQMTVNQTPAAGGGDDGIRLNGVVNFSLTQSNVQNNGDALQEHGVDATNVTGTVRFTDDTFTNNETNQVQILNDAAGANSADIEFNNVDFASTGVASAPNGLHGILATADGASSIDLRIVNGSDFNNLFSNSIQAQNEGTGTLEVTITGSAFNNVGAGAINIAQNDSGAVRFNIHDNLTFLKGSNNATSHSININQAGGAPASAVLEGVINNNVIGNNSAQDSGSAGGAGIRVFSIGSGTTNVVISNNNIQGVLEGILVSMGEDANAAHTVNATIFNNTVSVTNVPNGFEGIAVVAGTGAGDVGVLRLDMHDNTAGSSSSGGNTDFMVRQRFSTTIEFLNLGGANNSVATVQNYLDNTRNNNPNGPNGDWFITENSGGGGGGFDSTASVPQPSLPSPTQAPVAEITPVGEPVETIFAAPQATNQPISRLQLMQLQQQFDLSSGERIFSLRGPIEDTGAGGFMASPATPPEIGAGSLPVAPPEAAAAPSEAAAAAPPPVVNDDGVISAAELELLVAAAIDRWAASGATPEQIAAMKAVSVAVTDMMGVQIGGATAGHILIDNDAGGHGWFVDATPGDDSEYSGAGTRLLATAGSPAAGHVDLLTVLMHELGHQIGLGDDYRSDDGVDVMYGYMDVGERRLPAAGEAAGASGQAPDSEAFILSPVADIGTLPANKSVDIQFKATVDSYFNQVITPLSNTATAKGGNISDTNSNTNVTTIDTMTIGDRVFLDTNNNNQFDAGEGVNNVNLTLFADTNNNGVLDIGTDAQLLTTISAGVGAAIGSYSFANLSAGNYIVRVDASNFGAGGALQNRQSVLGGVDPDNDADSDDNGVAGPGGSIVSNVITLAYGTETTSDGGAIPKNDINNTLDFGFVTNQAPTANADSVNATEDTPVQYSTALTGNDTDPDLDTLTITAVSNFVNGTASVAAGVVTFTPNGNYAGPASFDYTISDGNGHTATATATVTVAAVDDAPTNNVPGAQSLLEDGTRTFDSFNSNQISISDIDAGAGSVTVKITAANGTFSLAGTTGLTFAAGEGDGTADPTMTFSGTLTDINAAIASIVYAPTANFNGATTLTIVTNDNSNTGSGGPLSDTDIITLNVTSINDEPAGADKTVSINEDSVHTFSATDFGFTDPLDLNGFAGVVIVDLPLQGALKLNGSAVNSLDFIPAAQIGTLTFTPDAEESGANYASFTFQVRDDGTTTNGGINQDQSKNTFTFNVDNLNDAPTLTPNSAQPSYTENGAQVYVVPNLTISDPDTSDFTGGSVSFNLTAGAAPSDVLVVVESTTPGSGIEISGTGDISYDGTVFATVTAQSATGATATLNGAATTAMVEALFEAVSFFNFGDDPTSVARTATFTMNDGGTVPNTGSFTRTVTVTAVNDTPAVSDGLDRAATEQTPIVVNPAVVISDPELGSRNGGSGNYAGATLTFVRSGGANAEDSFGVPAGTGYTVSGNQLLVGTDEFATFSVSGGQLTITFTSVGTPATTALVNAVGQAVTYTNGSDAPPAAVDIVHTLNDGSVVLNNQGTNATPFQAFDPGFAHITIAAVNDGPAVDLNGAGAGVNAVLAFTEGMGITSIAPAATVVDPDSTDFSGGTLTVALTAVHATDFLSPVDGNGITVNFGAGTVDYNGTTIATFTYSPTNLVFSLNGSADPTSVQALIHQVGFGSQTDNSVSGARTVTYTLTDGDGGSSGGVTATVNLTTVDDPPVAQNDDLSTPENVVKTGSLFDDNGHGADVELDTPALTISAVSGGTVGTPFALSSGAMLTVSANGSYSYDPNGVYNSLVPVGSGAVNTSATDTFTYTLLNGNTATVTVTINGVASAGDIYKGDGTNNIITTGSGNDLYDVSQGGNDTVSGNDGDDYFYFGGALTTADSVDGGIGTDVVALLGNYSMTLGASSLVNVERLTLLSGTIIGGPHVTYSITTINANVGSGQLLTVLGVGLLSDETLVFNGSGETDGGFYIAGGAANDLLAGGQKNDSVLGGGGGDQLYGLAGDDWLEGGAGADSLRGGTGKDLFVYKAASESTSVSMDHILDFEDANDIIDLSGIDANSALGGDQAFSFIGSNAFHYVAGELRAYESGGSWFVEGDTDGNGVADLIIKVEVFNGHVLGLSDFVL